MSCRALEPELLSRMIDGRASEATQSGRASASMEEELARHG